MSTRPLVSGGILALACFAFCSTACGWDLDPSAVSGWSAMSGGQGGKVVLGSGNKIYVADLKTGGVTDTGIPCATGSGRRYDPRPFWVADGSRFIFKYQDKIYLGYPNGNYAQVSNSDVNPSGDGRMSVWRGDGSKDWLVYRSKSNGRKIFRCNLDDPTEVKIVQIWSNSSEGQPEMTGSGKYIIDAAPWPNIYIGTIKADGTGSARRIASNGSCRPCASPWTGGELVAHLNSDHTAYKLYDAVTANRAGSVNRVGSNPIYRMNWSNDPYYVCHTNDNRNKGWVRKLTRSGGSWSAVGDVYVGGVNSFDVWVGSGGTTDNPPSVSITAPTGGATVSGSQTFSGTASDDNSVSAVEYRVDAAAWQAATGTTSWSFTLDTTSLTDGSHTVTVRATDNAGKTGSDSVSVIVSNGGAANQAPTVNAGTDVIVDVASPTFLDATVTDDGFPNGTLTTIWSTVSGPGTGTFADDSAVDTQVDFAVTGVYVLRLTADDGDLQSSDDIQVTVTDAPAINLLSPQGGEAWAAGSTHSILWTTVMITDVRIQYSYDGGATWIDIASTISDTDPDWENFSWVVPNTPSNQVFILIQEYFGDAPTQSAAFEITSGGGTDTDPPVISVTALGIEGTVDDSSIGTVTVGGSDFSVIGNTFNSEAALGAGSTTVTVSTADVGGNTATRTVQVAVGGGTTTLPVTIEAESMALTSGYVVQDYYITANSTGAIATTSFAGTTGTYRLKVYILAEDDGQPTVEVYVGQTLIGTIAYPLGASARDPQTVDLGLLSVSGGDEIKLVGTVDGGAAARVDKVTFEP